MIDIKWDKRFELGNKRIDFEHQVFVDLIKAISLASDENSSREKISRLLIELKKYAEFHFYSEENIMIDVNYPDYETHKSEHRILISTLTDKINLYRIEEIDVDSIIEFIFQWFALHTTQKDLLITKHISKSTV